MNWKKKAVVVAALALAVPVGGCSSSGAEHGAGAQAGQPRIVFVPGDLKDEFWITMACAVESAAKQAGATVSVQAPQDGTVATQKPLVDSITAAHPNVLIISPDDSAAMQAPIAAAAAAGIKVVLVNNTTTNPSYAVSQVLSDDRSGGAEAAKTIAKLHAGGGKVLVIGTQPGFSNTDARVEGFAQQAGSPGSGLQYLGVQYSQNSPQTAAQLVAAALQKDPDIAGIFAVNVNSAQGAATGLRQAGAQARVNLIGYDAGPNQIKDLRGGVVQGLIAQQPSAMGAEGVSQGLAALQGKPVEKLKKMPLTPIDASNIDTVGKQAAYQSACS